MATETSNLSALTGTWTIDPAHSTVEFVAKHMMVSKVRGLFRDFEGSFTVDEEVAKSGAEVTIQATSVDTGQPDRDNHLRSPDFFEVETYPELRFKSTEVELVSESKARITGDLTIKDTTRPVTLDVVFNDIIDSDAYGMTRAGFSVTATVNREEWNLTWNAAIEAGGVVVGKDVLLDLEIAATRS